MFAIIVICGLLCHINQTRVQHHLRTLSVTPVAACIARKPEHGLSLHAKNCHAPGYTFGEITAFGYFNEAEAFDAFMASQPHRKIILYPNFTHFGKSVNITMGTYKVAFTT